MNKKRRITRMGPGLLALALTLTFVPWRGIPAQAVSPDIVISQVYGGGGNSGATYTHDFVELFNRSTTTVSLAGWSVQYASATGTGNFGANSGQITELPPISLAPGQYLLIQEAQGSGGTTPLPTPDVTDSSPINMSATGGKIALVNSATTLGCNGDSTPCPADALARIVDLVGWDGANFYEGAPAPAASNTTAIFRVNGGCVDTDDNGTDFAAGAPNPRNSSSPLNPCGPPSVNEPVINEFSASTTGSPDVEYIEVFGDPSTDYSAFTVLEIEGDTSKGSIDRTFPVGTTDGGGFWTTSVGDLSIENGSITILLVEGFTGSVGNDLDTNDDGTLDSMPWTRIVDDVAVFDGGVGDLTYSSVALGPNYDGVSSFAPGGASRIPDGFDTDAATDWVRNDFDLAGISGFPGTPVPGEALNTPGAPNQVYVPPPEACGDPYTAIYDVQGSGAASPLDSTVVSIEGVVVGDFQNNASPDSGDLNGFHVQDPAGDGDAATSDGVFVYAPGGMDVSVGDAVRVRGFVSEFNGMTEVTASLIWVCSTGNSVAPASLSLPVTNVDDFEAYEGMLVTFPQALVISEYFNFDRFGEIVLTSERRLTPTAEVEPGPDAIQAAQDFLLNRITLDDGRTNQNPDPAIHPNGGVFDLTNLFRGGDTVENVTGALDYAFGLYRIQPTQGADYTNTNPRPVAPDAVGGSLTVATFNVLNYFTTLDDGVNDICGPAGDQECRGADDANEFTRQRDKIIAAMSAIDADVVGLMEIENHPGDVPTADLVAGLNDATAPGTYDYIATGAIGSDAIRVALLYQPASVTPLGGFEILDSSVDPAFNDQRNRPVLAQTFVENATGSLFTVAVNHLKSKSGSELDDPGAICVDADPGNDILDCDQGDGQGYFNYTRTLAATALAGWLASDPTGSGDPDFLIIGDLNSYDKEDPIDVLVAAGFKDLVFQYQGEDAYSYVFDGQTGYLDYQLASASLSSLVTGATVWHINADEADLIDYDTSFKQAVQDAIYAPDAYRSSDHDPVVIGLDLNTAMSQKVTALAELEALLPTDNKQDDKRIEKAIDRIDQSLNPAWWMGPSRLDLKKGKHVFDREHQAVQELEKVATVNVQAAIDQIVEADGQLAFVQLTIAMVGGGDPGRIAQAQGNMADAAAHVAAGEFAKAVLDYKRAWTNAVKAL